MELAVEAEDEDTFVEAQAELADLEAQLAKLETPPDWMDVAAAQAAVEARATGNIAVNNSMALGGVGTASISSTGAINNNQTNSAVVNAFAGGIN